MVEKVFLFLIESIELSFYIRACKELSETIKLDHRFAENCPEKKIQINFEIYYLRCIALVYNIQKYFMGSAAFHQERHSPLKI